MISCKTSQELEQVSVEDFFGNASQSSFAVSPDGKFVLFLQPYNNELNVFVKALDSDSVIRISDVKNQPIRKFFWAGNHHIVYSTNNEKKDNIEIFSATRDGKRNLRVKISPQTKVQFIEEYVNQDKHILLSMNGNNVAALDLYKLNLLNGEFTLLEKNPGNVIGWIVDNKGEAKIAVGSDSVTETIYYRENVNDKFRKILSINFKNTFQPIGFTKDEGKIYALSNLNRDKLALVIFDCKIGKEVKVIYENKLGDITGYKYFKSLNKVAYVNTEVNKREVHFLDTKIYDIYRKLKLKINLDRYKIVSSDENEQRLILRSFSDKSPGAYYIYFSDIDSLQKLADLNPKIVAQNMSPMIPIRYKTRDSLTIQGFLTIPKGKMPFNLPCVVIPHHGPYSKSSWGYDPEVQFLANRGYAVFQMNYRGSTGFGKRFENLGHKEWGKKIQDDITDGVKWLIDQDIADKDRIAVYGYSFGGFSALNQIIYNPDLYACAISNSGLSNLFTYLKGVPLYYKPYEAMFHEIIGNPEKDIDYLKYSSPVFHTEKLKKPIFIVQGGKDPKVNVHETNQFVKELRKRKTSVKYLLNDNEGHYFSNVENKLLFYRELEAFLAQHLKY